MKRLTLTCENIKFYISEYPFADTANFRFHSPFPERKFARKFNYQIDNDDHFFKNVEYAKTHFAFDLIRSEHAEFFDTQVSLARWFFDGRNTVGFKRRYDFERQRAWKLNILKLAIRYFSGVEQFNSFTCPSSRYDVGLVLRTESGTRADAEILRDYFSMQKIPYLSDRKREFNTHYWNNRTAYKKVAENTYQQPNRTFACYITDDNGVRLENRLYNRRGITALKYRTKFRKFSLENNLRHLLDWDFMNNFFWSDAINLFTSADRKRIVEFYDLKI